MTMHTDLPSPVAEPALAANAPRGARRGAGLIEVMIAITIFALIATSHARVTLLYTIRAKEVQKGASRSAALQEYIVRLASVPFDSLSNRVGCTTVSTGTLPNTRCISVVDVSGSQKTVTLIFTPTATAFKPDTVIMTRTKQGTGGLIT